MKIETNNIVQEKFRLAAIDIGSNGARLLIKEFPPVEEGERHEAAKVMFLRVPLRLGADVFTLGKISKERQRMMLHMLKGFRHFMLLYRVVAYRACATSAMRDAENGKKVLQKIAEETGIGLEIIGGEEEAQLLCNGLVEERGFAEGSFAFVDVGGGSTEVSLIHDGRLVESHSYNIGTLRLLSNRVMASEVRLLEQNLGRYAEMYSDIRIIGSGGNINKLNKICRHSKGDRAISVEELRELHDELKAMSIEERMEKYRLRDDRADVIVPAAEVFLKAADCLKAEVVLVPNISLADNILGGVYEEVRGIKN